MYDTWLRVHTPKFNSEHTSTRPQMLQLDNNEKIFATQLA